MSGDLIMSTYSHQIALNALLSEHISLYGLSVKILHRQDSEFPGGYAYHEKHDMMKEFLSLPSSLLSSSSSSSLSKDGTKNNGTQSIPTKDIMLPVPQNLLPERHPYIFHFWYVQVKGVIYNQNINSTVVLLSFLPRTNLFCTIWFSHNIPPLYFLN